MQNNNPKMINFLNKKMFWDFYIKNKAAMIAFGLLSVMGIIVFHDYLFSQKVFLFLGSASDSANIGYPALNNMAGYISMHGIPKWSFRMGMGQSIFPFCLRDPFDIFLIMAGKAHILYGIAIKELVKIIFSGLVFFYYLKLLRLSDFTAIIGCLFYSFCSFMIVGCFWSIFSFEAFNMALMLLSFELMFLKRNYYLFPPSVFLLCISQPFNLYVYGIFLFFYVLLRHVQENKFQLKPLSVNYLKIAILCATGILLSAPFLLENINMMFQSPRGSGANSSFNYFFSQPEWGTMNKFPAGVTILRLFSSDMLGGGNRYNGWWNYLEAPLLYCGLPCLLLIPQFFCFINNRKKFVFALFFLVWIIPLVFPWFKYAFWLFTGDYFRALTFFISFIMIFYAVHALDFIITKKRINIPVLVFTLALLFWMLNYNYFPPAQYLYYPEIPPLVHSIYFFVSIMLGIYGLILIIISRQSSAGKLKYLLLAAVVLELTCMSFYSTTHIEATDANDLAMRIGYNDFTLEAINYINSRDKSFYRIDKTYSSTPARFTSLNDGMVQGYNGTSSYNSFNQLYYVYYLQLFGLINPIAESESRWAPGLINRPILESENRVKYLLTKNNISDSARIFYDSVAIFHNVRLLQNRFVLPFGYTYTRFIKKSQFYHLNSRLKDMVSLMAGIIEDSDSSVTSGMSQFALSDTINLINTVVPVYSHCISELSKDTLQISSFDESRITGSVKAEKNEIMYLSLPFDKGWSIKLDNNECPKIILNGGMTGIKLSKGSHTIELAFHLYNAEKGMIFSLLGLVIYAGLFIIKKHHTA